MQQLAGRQSTEMPFDWSAAAGGTHQAIAPAEGLASLAHDARNMVTALGVYCELLRQPGVLNPRRSHLLSDLNLITDASRKLVEEMDLLATRVAGQAPPTTAVIAATDEQNICDSKPIANLARELRANQNLLAALAGPAVRLRLRTTGGEHPVRLRADELTRILVNLVRNAAEAMPDGGEVEITLDETHAPARGLKAGDVVLCMADSGPGIPEPLWEAVFNAGFTSHAESDPDANWHGQHRGLGLAITRGILASVGGSIRVTPSVRGARFEIHLPLAI